MSVGSNGKCYSNSLNGGKVTQVATSCCARKHAASDARAKREPFDPARDFYRRVRGPGFLHPSRRRGGGGGPSVEEDEALEEHEEEYHHQDDLETAFSPLEEPALAEQVKASTGVTGLCPDFYKIWEAYPPHHVDSDILLKSIGLGWLTNTCAIRTTIALWAAGYNPGKVARSKWRGTKYSVSVDGETPIKTKIRTSYLIRVLEVEKFVNLVFGRKAVVAKGGRGTQLDILDEQGNPQWRHPESLYGHAGLIHYSECGWTDATGHWDVWDGETVRNHGYADKCNKVEVIDVCNPKRNVDFTPLVNYMKKTKAARS